jgi:hypothetical protein
VEEFHGLNLGTVHVKFDIKTFTQVMINTINHNIEDYSSKHSVSTSERQKRLTLPAKPDRSFAFIAAYTLGQDLVLEDDLDGKETQIRVVGPATRAVGVLE